MQLKTGIVQLADDFLQKSSLFLFLFFVRQYDFLVFFCLFISGPKVVQTIFASEKFTNSAHLRALFDVLLWPLQSEYTSLKFHNPSSSFSDVPIAPIFFNL